MVVRDVEPLDVYRVLTTAESCRALRTGTWRLNGTDRLSEPLSLIVELRAGVVVVTLFRGDEP